MPVAVDDQSPSSLLNSFSLAGGNPLGGTHWRMTSASHASSPAPTLFFTSCSRVSPSFHAHWSVLMVRRWMEERKWGSTDIS